MAKHDDRDRVTIFDTTLRDGEQSPGASMNLEEKLRIALTLEQMDVDVIEAGFPASSPGDFEAVYAIARQIKNSTVCGLARAVRADIEGVAEAIKPAPRGRIHTFISTSPLHMQYKLQMDESAVLARIADSVAYARRFTDDIEWSAEDASRSDHDFLCRCIEAAITAGARTINIPDTVGYAMPDEFGVLIAMIRNRVPNIDKAVISVHCHNDLGLAVANSLTAIQAGARQVECTINGLGERAGNAAMEEIVMALRTRSDRMPFITGVRTENIMRASRLVSAITGFVVQPNKAIVGANAFAHESGIHQDGMLKHAGTYEIMSPESVGLTKSKLVLGKHSGRHAFREKLRELSYELGDNALEDAFARFKNLADRKKDVFDEDIIALVDDTVGHEYDCIKFGSLEVKCGTRQPWARLLIEVNGETKLCDATGDGPVAAAFECIKQTCGNGLDLDIYEVHGVTGGIDAQARVSVRLKDKQGHTYSGTGADTDTVIASVKAYLNALNKYMQRQQVSVEASV